MNTDILHTPSFHPPGRERVVILGAGQFGQAALALLNQENLHILAFGDNKESLWGTHIHGFAVMSVKESLALSPDLLLISVADAVRSESLASQARSLGFSGPILYMSRLHQYFDVRSAVLWRLGESLKSRGVPGALAELGVYKGDTAWKLNTLFPDRKLYLFDTFRGFDARDVKKEKKRGLSRAEEGDFSDTSPEAVLARLPFREQAVIRQGYFPDTSIGLEDERFALVSLDADLFAPILAGLAFFYPRLNPGGAILLHDFGSQRFPGAARAVAEYEKTHGPLPLVPLCDLHGSAVILRP